MKTLRLLFLFLPLALATHLTYGGSATWDLNPISGDWNTAANWTPTNVPNGPSDVATFGVSQRTAVSLSAVVDVDSIVFNPGASAYTIAASVQNHFTLEGAGIVNHSGQVQTFNVLTNLGGGSGMFFRGTATAGSMTVFNNSGAGNTVAYVDETFAGQSSADHATFINQGAVSNTSRASGVVQFILNSSAGNATFINNPGITHGGQVTFGANTTAANAIFVCNGGTVAGSIGGSVSVADNATCANGVFTLNGTDAAHAVSGAILFFTSSSAGNATFIANGGRVSGGLIRFEDGSTGGNGRMELFGNGEMDISVVNDTVPVTAGSLEGDGLVFLGIKNLSVGSNSLSTTFAGTIADGGVEGGTGGSLTKVGADTSLELSGANTYTGGTVVTAGSLIVSNTTGSATGAGAVMVNAGTLGGGGTIAGAVTMGTGSGTGAFLAPAAGTKTKTTLTIQSALTFNADATYICTAAFKGPRAQSDLVVANGVTINDAASLSFRAKVTGTLRAGTTLTIIDNTSALPISGSFVNAHDGGFLILNGRLLLVNYEGGDGNDLTLTVQP